MAHGVIVQPDVVGVAGVLSQRVRAAAGGLAVEADAHGLAGGDG